MDVERLPLSTVQPPRVPGAYLQFFGSSRPEVVDVVGHVLSAGEFPIYAGLATVSLAERIGRYRQSLSAISAIDERDVHVGVIPCTSRAWAAFTEATLIDGLDRPLMNRLFGWGTKVIGATRTRQQSNAVDGLWPGRTWTEAPSTAARIRARLAVVAYLAELDPEGPRWPALLPRPPRLRAVG